MHEKRQGTTDPFSDIAKGGLVGKVRSFERVGGIDGRKGWNLPISDEEELAGLVGMLLET